MGCPGIDQLEALAEDALAAETADDLRTHLDGCSSCRTNFAEITANLEIGTHIARLADSEVRTGRPQPAPTVPGYRLLREIGRGGSGIVYEAQQVHPRRRVAVKVFHGRTLDEYHSRLFQREAEALARLKHPAIAAIYEANRTPDNLQYFVMELVEGQQLGQYAQQAALTMQTRLELFRQICLAVHYAHQRGVIHRDLKPSNILVDAAGNPKILDFGLSRITDDESDHTFVSEVGRIQGTLHYMSPEQSRGNPEEIDLRTDVYALGIVLFQLVTWQLPYKLDRTKLLDALKVIAEQPPARPRSLNPAVARDVETIILKALEKDPDRRYPSAATLAEDIERYLNSEPILAAPHTFAYQLQKLIGRHKAPFAAAGALFVLIVAFGAWMSVQYRQAEILRQRAEQQRGEAVAARELADERLAEMMAARERAEQEAAKASAINDFLRKMLGAADPTTGQRNLKVSEVLDWAAENAAIEFADRPEIHAALEHTIGTAYFGLGLLAEGERLLESAVETRLDVLGEDDASTQVTINNYAALLQARGKLDDAETWKRRVLAIRERLFGPDHRNTRMSRSSLANLLQSQGKLDEAEVLLRETLAGLERTQPGAAITLSTRNSLALLLWERGDHAEAEPLLRETVAGLAERFGDEHPHTLSVLNNHALVLKRMRRIDEAVAQFRVLLQTRERILGPKHPDTLTSRHNLAAALLERGELDEAERLTNATLRARRDDLGGAHEETMLSISLLAEIAVARGDADLALELFGEALEGAQASLPDDHWRLGDYRCRYGDALARVGRHEEGERYQLDGIATLQASVGDDHPFTQRSISDLVAMYERLGNAAAAERWRACLQGASSPTSADESE